MYGVFLSLGEFGPGDNIGLIAAKSSSSMVRGQFYSIAAAIGKIGAFAGSYAFTKIAARFDPEDPTSARAYAGDFYVASALAVVAGGVAYFAVGELGQDCVQREDEAFLQYLARNGYDVALLHGEDTLGPALTDGHGHAAAAAGRQQHIPGGEEDKMDSPVSTQRDF